MTAAKTMRSSSPSRFQINTPFQPHSPHFTPKLTHTPSNTPYTVLQFNLETSVLTPPLSRRHSLRISHYCTRLDAMVAALDALPDRRAPLSRAFAGRYRRSLNEGRALLGLAPARRLEGTRQGVEFFLETTVIWHHLKHLNLLRQKANPRVRGKSNPRRSAPW